LTAQPGGRWRRLAWFAGLYVAGLAAFSLAVAALKALLAL
jgi:hypothetical protein